MKVPGSGGGPGTGAAGMPGTTPVAVPTVDLASCGDLGTTVDTFEQKFFPMRCGATSGEASCHRASSAFGDFATLPLFSKMSSKKTVFHCAGALFADRSAPSRSLLAVAVHDVPVCPNGKTFDPTRRMPVDRPALTTMERACLESYLREAAKQ